MSRDRTLRMRSILCVALIASFACGFAVTGQDLGGLNRVLLPVFATRDYNGEAH